MPDVNDPLPLNAINSVISQYASPDVAESDLFFNAPNTYRYLTDSYQRLSGDFTGDPFTAASTARANALTAAATAANTAPDFFPQNAQGTPGIRAGAGAPATGVRSPAFSPFGGGPTISPTTGEVLPPNTPVANPNNLSPWALRELGAETARNAGTKAAAQWNLAGTPVPPFNAPDTADFAGIFSPAAAIGATIGARANYFDTLKKRATLSGVGNEYDALLKSDPNLLKPNPEASDYLLQRTDASGKAQVIAGQDLHAVATSPIFRTLLQRDPTKAYDLYHAVTGRDYETDREATAEKAKITQESEQKAIQDIRDRGVWDPVSGRFQLKKEISGLVPGTQQTVYEPLSDYQQGLMDKYGVQHFFPDIDTSKFTKIQSPRGLTDDEETKFRQVLAADRQANPGKPLQQAVLDAYKVAAPPPGRMAQIMQTLAKTDPSAREALAFYKPEEDIPMGINSIANVLNILSSPLRGNQWTGRIPDIPMLPSGGPARTPQEIMAIRAMVDRGNYLGMPSLPGYTPSTPATQMPAWLRYMLPSY